MCSIRILIFLQLKLCDLEMFYINYRLFVRFPIFPSYTFLQLGTQHLSYIYKNISEIYQMVSYMKMVKGVQYEMEVVIIL
jgi:hypothetical protein